MSGTAFRFLEKAKSREPKLMRLMIRFWFYAHAFSARAEKVYRDSLFFSSKENSYRLAHSCAVRIPDISLTKTRSAF